MKAFRYSTQFKHDYKRYARLPQKVKAFEEVFNLIVNELPLREEHHLHPLKGIWKGYLECHIESDLLLIWIDGDMIEFTRIGSHSELFGG